MSKSKQRFLSIPLAISFFFSGLITADEQFVMPDPERAKVEFLPVLNAIKNAVSQQNIAELAGNIAFPLTVVTDVKKTTDTVSYKKYPIPSSVELGRDFNKVFTELNRNLIQCLTLENMTYDRSRGYLAAYGNIWFDYVLVGSKFEFKLTSVSLKEKVIEKWMAKNCKP